MIDGNVMTYLGLASFEQNKDALDKAVEDFKSKAAMSEAKSLTEETKPAKKKRGAKEK
jgi:hypothetical protein